jgi:hypothetical protein
MTPIIVEALREMNLKITGINDLETPNTFREGMVAWFANASNHITRIFTGEVCLTDPDGTSECLNKNELGQLKQLLQAQKGGTPSSTPSIPDALAGDTAPSVPVVDPVSPQEPVPATEAPVVPTPEAPVDQGNPPQEAPTAPTDPTL